MLVTNGEVSVDYEEFAKVLAEKLMNIKETKWVVETWINPDKFETPLKPLEYKQIEFDTYEEAETFADNFEALDKNYMAVVKTVRRGELK